MESNNRVITVYFDDEGNITSEALATRCRIYEFDQDGALVLTTWGTLRKQTMTEEEREKEATRRINEFIRKRIANQETEEES